jgi:hypothetical protein
MQQNQMTSEERLRLLGITPPLQQTDQPLPQDLNNPDNVIVPLDVSPGGAPVPVDPNAPLSFSELEKAAGPDVAAPPTVSIDASQAHGMPVGTPIPSSVRVPPPIAPELAGSPAYQAQTPHAPTVEQAGANVVAAGVVNQKAAEAKKVEDDRKAQQNWLDDLTKSARSPMEQMTGDAVHDAAAAMRNQNVIGAQDELGRYRESQAKSEQAQQESSVRDQQLALQKKQFAETAARDAAYQQQYEAAIAKANQAVDDMVAATPDPDSLLGGKGSWGRALTMALRFNNTSVGSSATASMIDDYLKSSMESQNSKFSAAQERVKGLTGQAKAVGDMVKTFDESDAAKMAALEKMAATALQGIALKMSDPIQRAKLLQASEKMGQMAVNKAQLEGAKTVSEITKNEAEADKALFGKGGAAGNISGSGKAGSGDNSMSGFGSENLTPDQRKRAVWIDPTKKPLLFTDDASANKFREELSSAKATVYQASQMQTFLKTYKGSLGDLWKYARSPEGAWLNTSAKYLAANEAKTLGGKGKGMIEFLAGDNDDPKMSEINPDAIVGSLNGVIDSTQTRVNSSLSSSGFDADAMEKQGIGIALPKAAPPAPEKSIDDRLSVIGAPPTIKKDGTYDTTVNGQMISAELDAADQKRRAQGMDRKTWDSKLGLLKANVASNLAMVRVAKRQAEEARTNKAKGAMTDEQYRTLESTEARLMTILGHIDQKLKTPDPITSMPDPLTQGIKTIVGKNFTIPLHRR